MAAKSKGNSASPSPLDFDTVAKLLKGREDREKQKAILDEEVREYKRIVNTVFSSKSGKLFGKYLIRFCAINSFDEVLNPAKLVEDAGKRKVYNQLIRPYLDKSTLAELENQ